MVLSTPRLRRAGLAAVGIGALALGGASAQAAAPHSNISINGAGSTFVAPILQGAWVPGYTAAHSSVQVNYSPIGSGAGISLWTQGKIDFAGSDALLNAKQQNLAKLQCQGGQNAGIFKIPVTIGAVALIYNVPGVTTGLKLTPTAVADIFLGKVHNWNDAEIARSNAGVKLPKLAIQTVHRADGSGTTYITTHYLSDVSPAWKSGPGSGSTVSWPNGLAAAKSSGVSAAVQRTAGAISYVDLAYAIKNHLTYASVQNKSRRFVAPSTASASAAADSFATAMPGDMQQLIVNSPATAAYPITGYSYIFMCKSQTGAKGKALVDFVRYVVTTGQAAASSRYYAPLPKSVQRLDTAALNSM